MSTKRKPSTQKSPAKRKRPSKKLRPAQKKPSAQKSPAKTKPQPSAQKRPTKKKAGTGRLVPSSARRELTPGIFDVHSTSLHSLSGQHAVLLFRDLLWAEARRVGLGVSAVTINERIEIPDGGIDASIAGDLERSDSALVAGRTWFQIKGGQRFEPWTPGHLKRELFDKKQPSRSALAGEVAQCLEGGGRYVLVSFGHDLTTQRRRRAEAELRALLLKCGFPDPHVEVWGAGQVVGFMRVFPSLCLVVNGAGSLDLQSLESWSENQSMAPTFVPGQAQRDLIDQITTAVRGDVRHVRLTGEPGLGKTRLALEALRPADLAPVLSHSSAERSLFDFRGANLTKIESRECGHDAGRRSFSARAHGRVDEL